MLYRFRNTARLLKSGELEDQYFYFAGPTQQNDPMEGDIEFYWEGDLIAWLGIFKHYVWQIFMTLFMLPLKPSLDALRKLHLNHSEIHMKNTKLPRLRSRLENDFSQDAQIYKLAMALGKSNLKISAIGLQTIFFQSID